MMKMIVVFFFLWLLAALGIRRVHLLRGRMGNIARDFGVGLLAAAIVSAALSASVILF
jgi:hypothetical protein